MKTYTVTVFYDVPHYAHIEVDADSEADAMLKAIMEAPSFEFAPDWDTAGNYYAHVYPDLQPGTVAPDIDFVPTYEEQRSARRLP